MKEILLKYKDYMDKAMIHYNSEEEYKSYFNRVPKFRYDTFEYCLNHLMDNDLKSIVELGTTRSFVDGKFEGVNDSNPKYWDPNDPSKWDWSAGCFTKVFGEIIQGTDITIESVDLASEHIKRCKVITEGLDNITHYVNDSRKFLSEYNGKIGFIYMDTGNVTPIERTAILHLEECKILIERDLMESNGIILIDDVRNIQSKKQTPSEYGKALYSIPYLLENGYKIVMDEYQVILIKG